jgi:hypothetical protein
VVLVEVLLDEPRVFVTYGCASMYCVDGPGEVVRDPGAPWRGQENGICGAALPGALELVVGTHTGWIPFRVESHTGEPAVDDAWEEIVEVAFAPTGEEIRLRGLDGDEVYGFRLPLGNYRARYHVRGIDEGDHTDDVRDAYLIQFWPAVPVPDRIVKVTSERAAYWHRARRPLTEAEQADEDRRQEEDEAALARERWGDRTPVERLRDAQGLYLSNISALDIELEFRLAELPDDVHRKVTTWVTLRCLTQAGLADVPQFAPAVAALRQGRRVPAPFDDPGRVWSLVGTLTVPMTSVPAPPHGEYEQSPQNWASSAIFHSANGDSLSAVLEVLVCLAYVHGQHGYRRAFADVRAAFPELA